MCRPAAILGKFQDELTLDGLTDLCVDTAHGLASHGQELFASGQDHRAGLRLNGLSEISSEVAAVLATHNGLISLNGLRQIDSKAARSLGGHKGTLMLNGLLTVSDETAGYLVNNDGHLSLDGVSELSVSVCCILSKITSDTAISLTGLTRLTADEGLEVLPEEGANFLGNVDMLCVDGSKLSDKSRAFLEAAGYLFDDDEDEDEHPWAWELPEDDDED